MEDRTALLARVIADLADIANDCLPGEEVTPDDDLLDVGFDSLTLIVLAEKVDARFGTAVELETLLVKPSLTELAGHLVDGWGDRLAAVYHEVGR